MSEGEFVDVRPIIPDKSGDQDIDESTDTYDAMEWLEHSVNLGFINYPYLNEYCVFLKSIRSEERFEKLMVRVKYEWENFEV